VQPHTTSSVDVGADGSTTALHRWPRPIVGELPYGDGGAVAWSNGLSRGAKAAEPACVMYRPSADAAVQVVELPIRPTTGFWWNGRLYWDCFPTAVDSWIGLASWAPDAEVRLELPDVVLHGLREYAGGLLLDPCEFRKGQGYVRRRQTHGRLWLPGSEPTPAPLGELGAASAAAQSNGWTATAYPEADLVQLDCLDGRSVRMHCYYPLRLAWTGRSLLVSTADREVLLFEDLLDGLEAVPALSDVEGPALSNVEGPPSGGAA
jgi:hypothetical protein